ncbi:MAG: helix-turn-helix transcriptional regulator [Moorella sp. (in: Bacteria)]|nr:helix-turn-helix transcriptional regulator [Moorella sp. (in: firmicutes)]
MPSFPEIGERIRFLREKRGLTQEDLADALGVSRPVADQN